MKRGLDLPRDWAYVEQVFPALKIGEPVAHVQYASPLMSIGLSILQRMTSSQARAVLRGINLRQKTGLIVPVTEDARDKAVQLGRRLSREAATDGDLRWRTREVLACAMFLAAQSSLAAQAEGF